MNKIKLGVIFGGMSTEHDVSITSGTSVIKNLDKNKYEIYPVYIDKDGNWFEYTKKIEDIDVVEVGEKITEITKIDNPIEYLQECDVIFPVLHGLYGEDGTIQGMLELIRKPYVGCRVLSSSVCMDKVYSKFIFKNAKIEQADYIYLRKYGEKYIYVDDEFNERVVILDEISSIVEKRLGYPVFIKPSNSGSSIGINKAENKKELEEYVEYAAKFDKKILIEEAIDGREVECAVLGNEEVEASGIGEILSAEDFYTFDAKYKNSASRTVIPADVPKDTVEKIRKTAIKAFKAIDGKGLSRVDFFIENKTNRILLIEVNTMPGFTQISMYPKLWEQEGVKYNELLDKLINLALEEK